MAGRALLAILFAAALALAAKPARSAIPQGVWLIDAKAAVQIYDCSGLMCGRIVWLSVSRDPQGRLDRDKHNPDAALQSRGLCGLTMLWNLHPVGPDRWTDGWFYNPHDGLTYRVSAQLVSADVMVARIYIGLPLFGQTKTLQRVPQLTSEGWC